MNMAACKTIILDITNCFSYVLKFKAWVEGWEVGWGGGFVGR